MATRASIKQSSCFSSVLSAAILEWILMLLLFFDAWFSYLVTKFSRLCKLQTPCLLCSRLDHFLGNEKPGFYWNLICDDHKSEISSLAFCRVHGKLADVHSVCEACLLSFATEKKSNPETYRSLVGKLGVDFGVHGHHSVLDTNNAGIDHECRGQGGDCAPLLTTDKVLSSGIKTCSCCSSLFESKPHGFGVPEFRNPSRHDLLHVEDDMSKTRQSSSFSPAASPHLKNRDLDLFTHIGYSEVKLNSDSESEPVSEDDGVTTSANETAIIKKDFACQCPEFDPIITIEKSLSADLSDGLDLLINATAEPTSEIPEKQPYEAEACEYAAFSSSNDVGHVLEELNWNHFEIKTDADVPSVAPQEAQDFVQDSDVKENDFEKMAPATTTTTTTPDSTNVLCSSEINTKIEPSLSETAVSVSSQMDLNDAYKLAVGARGSLPSPTFAEVLKGKGSAKIQEDFKLLISQFSAARGLESPWLEMSSSPRALEQGEESVLQNITKTLSLERNESGLESLDGSLVSEIEGESTFDRLKRQIELDKKSISLLYKELEEERNASAIAANQAMAMITKLQKEKASMQMEALQYQRMMEEQAEYDQEALQQFQDLLAQKEKEMQYLEEELDSFRKRFTNGSYVNEVSKETESVENSEHSDLTSQVSKQTGLDNSIDPLLCLDEEKAYISDCLTKLEEKLRLFSNYGVYDSTFISNEDEHVNVNGDYCVQPNSICWDSYRKDRVRLTTVPENDLTVNGYCSEDISSVSVQDVHQQINSHSSVEEKESVPENLEGICESSVKDGLKLGNPPDFVAVIKEVSQLSRRLASLEADRNFLEHAMNSLRNGNDGTQFIRDIASDLRELRQNGITRREF